MATEGGEHDALLSQLHHAASSVVWVDSCAQNVSLGNSDKMPKLGDTFLSIMIPPLPLSLSYSTKRVFFFVLTVISESAEWGKT